MLLSKTGKPAEAEAEYRKALAIQQKLADDNPTMLDYREFAASGYTDLADLHRRLGRTAEAKGGYGRAIAIREAL